MNNKQGYLSKQLADKLVESLASNECVMLDDFELALYEANEVIPNECYVRNALDEDRNSIPLEVIDGKLTGGEYA